MQSFEQFKEEMGKASKEKLKLYYDHLDIMTLDPNHFNNIRENNQKRDYIQRLLIEKEEIDVSCI